MCDVIDLTKRKTGYKDRLKAYLPKGGNLDFCLTCGACASGCPASGIDGLDPRKFVRMVLLGMDEEILKSDWIWVCTMCQRCRYVCPMDINIGGMIFFTRQQWPRERVPKNMQKSCDVSLQKGNSTGLPKELWLDVVGDTLKEARESDPSWEGLTVNMDRKGAKYYLNQNAKEPTSDPEAMVPLWKILHTVGADWTYSSESWDATNWCMFTGNDEDMKTILGRQVKVVEDLGCRYYINTE
jgi:heterodisulfide reductase subunit C